MGKATNESFDKFKGGVPFNELALHSGCVELCMPGEADGYLKEDKTNGYFHNVWILFLTCLILKRT